MNQNEILKIAVKALDSKKAQDIKAIGVEDLTIIADYFVIASGSSTTQVKALADEVEYQLSQNGVEPHHIEGRNTKWIVLDYSTVVVHVFYGEQRDFYKLERLWQDGKMVDIEKLLED